MAEATAAADAGPGGPRLTQLLPIDAIRLGETAADWRAAVRLAGDALVASGATTPAYTDEMVATVEQLGPYIVIAPGIALAHSRPSPAVLRAGISLVTLARAGGVRAPRERSGPARHRPRGGRRGGPHHGALDARRVPLRRDSAEQASSELPTLAKSSRWCARSRRARQPRHRRSTPADRSTGETS